jgi:C-terminal processing protease CtpA/Prc
LVRIVTTKDPGDPKVYVKNVVRGGSAWRDGKLQVGDVIRAVDGIDVTNEAVSDLRRRIVGPQGTHVRLMFSRPGQDDFEVMFMIEGHNYIVELDEGNARVF